MENYRGKARSMCTDETLQRLLQASLMDFEIPMGSWEQTALERSNWRGLINKGAEISMKQRESVKLKESAEKTNGPPADSMTLASPTCNGQFRARIGLVSQQKIHRHT